MANKKAQKTAGERAAQAGRSQRNKQKSIERNKKKTPKGSKNAAHVFNLAANRLRRLRRVLKDGVGADRLGRVKARIDQLETFLKT
jgi:hypothetical protein